MQNRPPPVDKGDPHDHGIEPGYLLGEQLSPEETLRIETRLAAPRSGRRLWILGAAAAVLLLFTILVVRERSTAPPEMATAESPPRATSSREMVLEIVRTDLPDAKPYKLRIKLETPTNHDSEVKP